MSCRWAKSAAEVDLMQASASATAAAMRECMQMSHPGVIEHQLATIFGNAHLMQSDCCLVHQHLVETCVWDISQDHLVGLSLTATFCIVACFALYLKELDGTLHRQVRHALQLPGCMLSIKFSSACVYGPVHVPCYIMVINIYYTCQHGHWSTIIQILKSYALERASI